MSAWKIELVFSDDSSNKFWRARVEGSTLYVNYGRIGSDGQTQVKNFPTAAAAEKELDKLEKEKRKKGYEDASGDPSAKAAAEDEDEEEEEEEEEEDEDERPAKKKKGAPVAAAPAAPPPPAPAPAAAPRVGAAALAAARAKPVRIDHADYSTTVEGRVIDLRLTLDGSTVRTVVVERYASAEEAEQAFGRLKTQMVADGYQLVPARDTL